MSKVLDLLWEADMHRMNTRSEFECTMGSQYDLKYITWDETMGDLDQPLCDLLKCEKRKEGNESPRIDNTVYHSFRLIIVQA